MTVKQIWGIVLIVLGVFVALGSFSSFLEVNALDSFMNSMPFKSSGVSSLDSVLYQTQVQYVEAARFARIRAILGFVAGIGLSFWGTSLYRSDQKVSDLPTESQIHPEDENKYDGWSM